MKPHTLLLEKFGEQGEKTGWTVVTIASEIAHELKPSTKVSFRIKGTIDHIEIKQTAIIPMGNGDFILPIGLPWRRKLRKEAGSTVVLKIELDTSEIEISPDLLLCLEDEPSALAYFNTLTKSHKRYFSKWIEDAKTIETKSRRIAASIEGLSKCMDYGSMIRSQRDKT
jgi:Bacteriocin-protection, YdeI or OmpD-Associated/Domain of unknown function (DUF1905)